MTKDDETLTPLTAEQQVAVGEWYERYGAKLLGVVRNRLWEVARVQVPTSHSSVAQAVWNSLQAKHMHEVDIRDPDSAWALLLRLSWKHTDTLNKRAWNRVKRDQATHSINAGSADNAEDSASGFDPADERRTDPARSFVARECAAVLRQVDLPVAVVDLAGEALSQVEQADSLAGGLSDVEKVVLAYKLFGMTRDEIAEALQELEPGIHKRQVDAVWSRIKRQAAGMLRDASAADSKDSGDADLGQMRCD